MWKDLGGFTEDALVPLGLYGLQLALNWAWTPIFFGAHKLKWVSVWTPHNKIRDSEATVRAQYSSLLHFLTPHHSIQALVEIVALTGTVAATMVSWYSVNRTATLLMAPYLSWLCLATSLNYCIWRDNKEEKEE